MDKITLNITKEQEHLIKKLFQEQNWDYAEAASQSKDEFDPEKYEPSFVIPQRENEEECPFCMCRPCITDDSNRQHWWAANSSLPHNLNSKSRKVCYQKFWTMLYHRRVWFDERYLTKKYEALGLDQNRNRYTWIHRRDIMPNCVLKIVRGWYPNLPGIAYMDHMWE